MSALNGKQVHSANTQQGKWYWWRYLSPHHPQSIRSWFLWGQCPMTLVKTLTATSSRLHEPIAACCASKTHQQNHCCRLFFPHRLISTKKKQHQQTGTQIKLRLSIHTHTHTIEGVVSRMHLAELCHVLDWVTAGRGGAYAGFTGDASSLQSDRKTNPEKFTEWFYKNSIL